MHAQSTPRPFRRQRIDLTLPEGWVTVGMLLLLFFVAATGTAATNLTEGLWVVQPIALLGVLAGLALAKSRFNGRVASLFGAAYGLFTIAAILGMLFFPEESAHDRTIMLGTRIGNWVYLVISGGSSYDAAMFVVFMALVYWTMAVLAAWTIFRQHQIWEALLPAGVVLFINVYYYRGPTNLSYYLAAFLVLSLMLLVRTSLTRYTEDWDEVGAQMPRDMALDFLRSGLIAVAMLMLVAFLVPSSGANPRVSRAWSEMLANPWGFVSDTFSRSFSALNTGFVTASNDFYGDSLALGSGQGLSERTVMEVEVQDAGLAYRWYWRARTFDTYQNGQWTTGPSDEIDFAPDTHRIELAGFDQVYLDGAWTPINERTTIAAATLSPLDFPDDAERALVFANVRVMQPAMTMLYLPSQALWVDEPAELSGVFDDETGAVYSLDVVRANSPVFDLETYQTVSTISVAGRAQLRAAGQVYPPWVQARYLDVPDDITERTRELAAEITADAVTPYDKAKAIEAWLRENITYDLTVEAAPPGNEPIDYLLFESRAGYCNYYTSAMVMMLRSVGVPARMAVGFAEGQLRTREDEAGFLETTGASNSYFEVREIDAHAWPEVYFPGYGWVEFEPTVSQPELARPEGIVPEQATGGEMVDNIDDQLNETDIRDQAPEGELQQPGSGETTVNTPAFQLTVPTWLIRTGQGLLVVAVLAALLVAAGVGLEQVGFRGLSGARLAYARLLRAMALLGLPVNDSETPFERADTLARVLPDGKSAIETITEQYVETQFSPRDRNGDSPALVAWQALRRPLGNGLVARLLGRLHPPERNSR